VIKSASSAPPPRAGAEHLLTLEGLEPPRSSILPLYPLTGFTERQFGIYAGATALMRWPRRSRLDALSVGWLGTGSYHEDAGRAAPRPSTRDRQTLAQERRFPANQVSLVRVLVRRRNRRADSRKIAHGSAVAHHRFRYGAAIQSHVCTRYGKPLASNETGWYTAPRCWLP
jgi:hypothetical protein